MNRGDKVDFRVGLPVVHLDRDGLVGALWRPGEVVPDEYDFLFRLKSKCVDFKITFLYSATFRNVDELTCWAQTSTW